MFQNSSSRSGFHHSAYHVGVLVARFLGEHLIGVHLIGVLIEAADEVCFFEGDSRCVFL